MDFFGQRFVIAYDGVEMTEDIKEFCRRFAIGGIILFADNFSDPAQLSEAVAEVRRDCWSGAPLFISCDHEGGRVQRFRRGFTAIPPMSELGAGSPDATRRTLSVAARELARCGINLNFAPVADVGPPHRAGSIGDRAFSHDAGVVCDHVAAAVAAYQTNGVLACAKHFPGHGSTEIDSHRALPRVTRDALTEVEELRPFRAAIAAGVAGVMTAHIIVPNASGDDLPASLSRYWICDVLRGSLGFDGLVFSDAMEMTAIRDRWSPVEAGGLALNAGTDIVVFYLIEEQLRAVHDLCLAAARGAIDRVATDDSMRRIRRTKAVLGKCEQVQ